MTQCRKSHNQDESIVRRRERGSRCAISDELRTKALQREAGRARVCHLFASGEEPNDRCNRYCNSGSVLRPPPVDCINPTPTGCNKQPRPTPSGHAGTSQYCKVEEIQGGGTSLTSGARPSELFRMLSDSFEALGSRSNSIEKSIWAPFESWNEWLQLSSKCPSFPVFQWVRPLLDIISGHEPFRRHLPWGSFTLIGVLSLARQRSSSVFNDLKRSDRGEGIQSKSWELLRDVPSSTDTPQRCNDSLEDGGGPTAGPYQQRSRSYGRASNSSDSSTPRGQEGKKRITPPRRSSSSRDDDDDENDRAGRGGKRAKKSADQPAGQKRFACPFFKHNPASFVHRGACTGPGFLAIARVKYVLAPTKYCHLFTDKWPREHVYRNHRQPDHTCERCSQVFETHSRLQAHMRAEEPCQRDPQPRFDINKGQYIELKNKSTGGKNEYDRWYDIYRIIFPGSAEPATPCKYRQSPNCAPGPCLMESRL
jgi:hypothetical protein